MLDILLADDEPLVRTSIADALVAAGHRVTEAGAGDEALSHVLARVFDVAVLDIRLPSIDGLTLFRRLRIEAPSTVVVLMTAYARVSDAVEAIRGGAHDYVLKPFDPAEFAANVIGPIAERRAIRAPFERARTQLAEREVGTDFVGCTPFATRVRVEIDAASQSQAPLLVTGERGTGKRLVARLVHARSPRRDRPYVLVCCPELAPGEAEIALFGQGTQGTAGGEFAKARGGTLTVHEVGALSASCQALLSLALGDPATAGRPPYPAVPTDVRVIGTSRGDLQVGGAGPVREELRLKLALEIRLVPLREREADLPILLAAILARDAWAGRPAISPEAWEALRAYPFPGNVAELEGAIRRALDLSRGATIEIGHLPAEITAGYGGRSAESAERRPPRKSSGTHVIEGAAANAPAQSKRRRT